MLVVFSYRGGGLRNQEVAYWASDRHGPNFKSCVCRAVSCHSSLQSSGCSPGADYPIICKQRWPETHSFIPAARTYQELVGWCRVDGGEGGSTLHTSFIIIVLFYILIGMDRWMDV